MNRIGICAVYKHIIISNRSPNTTKQRQLGGNEIRKITRSDQGSNESNQGEYCKVSKGAHAILNSRYFCLRA